MKQLLVIGHVWPEPKTTAAGNRMHQLLRAFLKFGYDITFASTAAKTKYSSDLNLLGISEVDILLNDSSFNDFISELQPHIVLFDRFMVEEQFGWRVAESCPNALRILNTEDLHSLRSHREQCFRRKEDFTIQTWSKTDKAMRELASIYRSDLTLLVSTFELDLLANTLKMNNNLLLHLPFLLQKIGQQELKQWPVFEARKDFICYGNGKHAPNVDALNYLKKDIWPLIRKGLPNANLHIYGAYLPQQVLQMHSPKNGFLVHGWVSDLSTEIQKARLVLAPVRFGAGIKGKLAKAMQNGTPSITTAIGQEGMAKGMPWPGRIADNDIDFATIAQELYLDKHVWSSAQERGVAIINSQYDGKRLEDFFKERIDHLLGNLEEHRGKNVLGAILQHQSMASTKFMGKWIEEKNRKK